MSLNVTISSSIFGRLTNEKAGTDNVHGRFVLIIVFYVSGSGLLFVQIVLLHITIWRQYASNTKWKCSHSRLKQIFQRTTWAYTYVYRDILTYMLQYK